MTNDFNSGQGSIPTEPETDYQAIAENIDAAPATRHDVAEGGLLGAVGGAVVGGFAGGPLGAVIGAVVGGAASAAAIDRIDKHDHDNQTQITSDSPTANDPLAPNLVYYAAPGAFGTSLPGMVAPPIAETARDKGQPPHRSTEDDTDLEPWTTGSTNDDTDTNVANGEDGGGDEDLPFDDSIPNSAYSSAPNRVFEAGHKNTRSNAAEDYDDTPRQSSGNTAAEHLLAHTAPGAQAETDRRIFGGEPVMDESSDDIPNVSDAGELDEAETPAD